MRHVFFFAAVVVLIATVLFAHPTASEEPQEHNMVGNAVAQAVVCCTFSHDGEERTCAAVVGQTCDVCASFCG